MIEDGTKRGELVVSFLLSVSGVVSRRAGLRAIREVKSHCDIFPL